MTPSRRLTPAAQTVFGQHLDYPAVRIHCGLSLLPRLSAAVSPNGRIYFPKAHYLTDYTQAAPGYTLWLIHELTHIWQWQHGFKTWLGGLILAARGGYLRRRAYACPPPSAIRDFAALNMEQQAETLARCYASLTAPASAETAAFCTHSPPNPPNAAPCPATSPRCRKLNSLFIYPFTAKVVFRRPQYLTKTPPPL